MPVLLLMPNPFRYTLAAITRLYPLMRGGGKLSNLPPMRWLSNAPHIVTAPLRDGSLLRVPINDYVGRPIFWTGDFDRRVSWALHRILRPGDNVLDIGANLGVYAVQAARRVGPRGCVHAIEPQPEVATLLEESLALNGYDNTTVHRVGLSNHDGKAKLGYRKDDTGGRGIVPDDTPRMTLSIDIREATAFLDSLDWATGGADIPFRRSAQPGTTQSKPSGLGPEADRNVCSTVRLMKLDVEGHEAVVLEAAQAWLSKHPPKVILFESHAEQGPFMERAEVKTLSGLGYTFAALDAGYFRIKPTRIRTSDDAKRIGAIDYLALHTEALEQDKTLRDLAGW